MSVDRFVGAKYAGGGHHLVLDDRRRLFVGLDSAFPGPSDGATIWILRARGFIGPLHAGHGEGALDLIPADPSRTRGSGLGLRQGHARHNHVPSMPTLARPPASSPPWTACGFVLMRIRERGSSAVSYTATTSMVDVRASARLLRRRASTAARPRMSACGRDRSS